MRLSLDEEQLFVELPSGAVHRRELHLGPVLRAIQVIRVDAEPPSLVISEASFTPDERSNVLRSLRDHVGPAPSIVLTTDHGPGLVSGSILSPGSPCSAAAIAGALAAVQKIGAWDESEIIGVELEGHPSMSVRMRHHDGAAWDADIVESFPPPLPGSTGQGASIEVLVPALSGSPTSPSLRRRAARGTSADVVASRALERFSVACFRASESPGALAGELEAELNASLVGVREEGLDAEIRRILAELDAHGHALLAYPRGGGRRFYGATTFAHRAGLDLSFLEADEEEDIDQPWVRVSFVRQLLCPVCRVPMEGAGPFEMQFTGHGMVGGAAVHVEIAQPTPISLDVGVRSCSVKVGLLFRCAACSCTVWDDGPVTVAVR